MTITKGLRVAYLRLNKHYVHQHFIVLGLLEALVFVLVAWLTQHLHLLLVNSPLLPPDSMEDITPALVFALILSFCTLSMGVYVALVREGYVSMMLRTVVSFFLLGSIALYLINLLAGGEFIDRKMVFWGVLGATVLVFLVRSVFVALVDIDGLQRRIVIFGAGARASRLLEDIRSGQRGLGVKVLGCIPMANSDIRVADSQLLPLPENWLEFVKSLEISEIIVAPDERRSEFGAQIPLDDFLDCKAVGVPCTDVLSFYERVLTRIDVDTLKPSWLLFSDGFSNSRRHLFIKRLADLAISVLLLLLLWPVMLLAALAVKLDSRGPALYSQTRVGLNGREFKIYKFRSMRTDAEAKGAVWAKAKDDRVTRVGAFLRNTRIDELPQLYNVIAGHMSFVGPRPERPEFVKDLAQQIPFYQLRHKVKPGLMGWAQLKYPYGASVEDAKNKLKYDLYYAKNKSLFMDFLIMVQTVEIVLLGKGVR